MDKDRLFKLAGIERDPATILAEGTCGEGTCGAKSEEEQSHVDYENDDPVGRVADEFEKIVRFEMKQQDGEEDSHEIAADVMNALHKILHDRGLMV